MNIMRQYEHNEANNFISNIEKDKRRKEYTETFNHRSKVDNELQGELKDIQATIQYLKLMLPQQKPVTRKLLSYMQDICQENFKKLNKHNGVLSN